MSNSDEAIWVVMHPSCYAMILDLIRKMQNRERKLNKRGITTQWKEQQNAKRN